MDQPNIDEMKFETALAELESIVQSMESGNLELESSINTYRRGTALMQHCQKLLAAAEEQIRIFENGELRNFDPASREDK